MPKEFCTITYTPRRNAGKIEGAGSITTRVEVSDSRRIDDRISCKKDRAGEEISLIVAKNEIVDVLKVAVESELRNRGFSVDDNSMLLMHVELFKFYNDFEMGSGAITAAATINVNVELRDSFGDVVFIKPIQGIGRKTGIQSCSIKDALTALDLALKDTVSILASDDLIIGAMLKKY
jgi:uncharacterized lipoprotein YajG